MEITCILDPDNAIVQSQLLNQTDNEHKTKLLSERIVFYKYGERVPNQYVSIINPMAARLRIPNHPPGVNIYSCILLLDNNQRLNGTTRNAELYIYVLINRQKCSQSNLLV